MEVSTWIRSLSWFGIVVGCLGLVGCAETPVTPEAPPPRVTVQHPERRTLVDYDRYNGWAQAVETVEVRARVRGHIRKVAFTDGQLVKQGDVLFELDPRPFQAEIDRARDQLMVDQAQLDLAAANAKRDQSLFARKAISQEELETSLATKKSWEAKVEGAKHEIVRRELDLEYARVTAEISGRVGRANMTAGNLVNAGGSDPLLTTIVAVDPIHVYFSVDERSLLRYRQHQKEKQAAAAPAPSAAAPAAGAATDSSDLKPSPAASPSASSAAPATTAEPAGTTETVTATEPVTTTELAATTEPTAETKPTATTEPATSAAPLPTDAAAGETPPADSTPEAAAPAAPAAPAVVIPIEFGLETDEGFPHRGQLDFADNRIDPETGTIEVRGVAANPENRFVPGSRVRIRVPVSDEYEAILVPDVAILSDQDQRYVLVVNAEGIVVRRSIKLGRLLDDGMRVVLPGGGEAEQLKAEDWVVVLGLQRARVNYPVEPVDADGKVVPLSGPATKPAATGTSAAPSKSSSH